MPPASLTFIDLFCGCGGFSLGMERAGFRCLAAIDSNREAIATLRANFPELGEERARQEDLTKFRPDHLAEVIGTKTTDVIVGGPPCQGFSTARQRDGANHGSRRFISDDRRQLYVEFLRYVEFFQPRIFVMENVLGLQSAVGGEYFTRVQHEARLLNYRVVAQVADAFSLGVPQRRRRQLVIGVRGDLPGFFPTELAPSPRAFPGTTLGPVIGDLPPLIAGRGEESSDYDLERRRAHLTRWGKVARRYLYRVLEITASPDLTAHCARPHSERDLRDFSRLHEGESSAVAMRKRHVEFEWPYSKEHFKDRYTRQSRRKPCSTIVAHLSKDGLMFIHPTQNRSLTPREAARIQSFPDWFWFPVARTHQFRIIGNAVPPLVGEAVGLEVSAFLSAKSTRRKRPQKKMHFRALAFRDLIPKSQAQAAVRLQEIAALDRRQLRASEKPVFLRGWFALFYLFPGLHPDNALDHGDPTALWSVEQLALPGLDDFATHRFARSGWPVALDLLGCEAWRRYAAQELGEAEFYCAEAQRIGMKHRENASVGVRTSKLSVPRRNQFSGHQQTTF
jgi:DNA (cytosine-5)-methyltransferase 1